jgi:protein-S-isoprenylcysteine O-methyltransferase Ste14
MAESERRGEASDGVPNAANVGIVRPPLVFSIAIAAGLALHFAWPVRFVPYGVSAPLGLVTLAVAIALFVAAVRTFRTAGTPVPGSEPTTAIVNTGPYRFSRNPIYLAFSLAQLAIAFWANSAWPVITLVPAVLVMSLVVIPREEAYLEARFPSQYLPYKQSVRRWL